MKSINSLLFFCIIIPFQFDNQDNFDKGKGFHDIYFSKTEMESIVNLVNEARAKGYFCGIDEMPSAEPVLWNDKLAIAALRHSFDMYRNNFFSHNSSNGDNVGDRVIREEFRFRCCSENIAKGYKTESDVFFAWLSSDGHCRNMMSAKFNQIGIARVGDYWTMVLASGFTSE